MMRRDTTGAAEPSRLSGRAGPPGTKCLALAAVFLLLGACHAGAGRLPADGAPDAGWCCTHGAEELTVEYLGVGGWLLRMGDAALLTAPFFSNPGFIEVGFGRIEPDTAAIDAFLPPVDDVPAILVGHAHYDHLMDVPYILRRHAPRARMYGSRTAVNLVRGDSLLNPERLVSVEEQAGTDTMMGEWLYTRDRRVRFMPLSSGHAPHFMGVHLYMGQVAEPVEGLPERATGWLEGTPLAYLIDFLTPEEEVAYRIHFQDAASEAPAGFPPSLPDHVPVDLAILCAPGYEEVAEYPEGILGRLGPAHVLVGHWEDFFRPRGEEIEPVPGTDLEGFVERMTDVLPARSRWAMLEPGASLQILPAREP